MFHLDNPDGQPVDFRLSSNSTILTTVWLLPEQSLRRPTAKGFAGFLPVFITCALHLQAARLRHLNLSVTVLRPGRPLVRIQSGAPQKDRCVFTQRSFCMDFGLYHIVSQTKSYWIWFRRYAFQSIFSSSKPAPNSLFGAGFLPMVSFLAFASFRAIQAVYRRHAPCFSHSPITSLSFCPARRLFLSKAWL